MIALFHRRLTDTHYFLNCSSKLKKYLTELFLPKLPTPNLTDVGLKLVEVNMNDE